MSSTPPNPPSRQHACISLIWLHPPCRGRPTVNNYSSTTIVAAPPVYSPFGFGGYGFGGVSFMPIVPIPFFGGFLQVQQAQ